MYLYALLPSRVGFSRFLTHAGVVNSREVNMLYVSFRMNDKNDIVFGRIPYRPADGWTAENSRIFADPLFSEVAMMQYEGSY